jgi:hypothetical protein
MRCLVGDKIFTINEPSDGGEALYGATKVSSLLVSDSDISMFSIIIGYCQPSTVTPWGYLSDCVKEGGSGFEKVHDSTMYEFISKNSEFNKAFNRGMAAQTKILIKSINRYKEAFENVGSLVDVGGGIGETISMIVKEFPHIKGINFDLPHVISTAPEYTGVAHIGGNMFESIPKTDAIFLKEALPKKGGKILIVEMILNPKGSSVFDEMKNFFDLAMLVLFGGKERCELEWKELLEDGGFPQYKIIHISPTLSLIEAYPE